MTKPKFPSRYKPGDVVGKGAYVVVELVAQGGMAEVYRVTEVETGREYAFKVLQFRHQQNDRIRKKMESEARALIELRHRGLVRVFEAGVDDGGQVVFFVMELLEGRTLLQLLHFYGRIPLISAMEICAQVADALAHLHKAGIVHRDVKPDNIIVLADDTVKIIDLGAARFERYGIVTTQPGQPIGTALYMSPEHLTGEPHEIDGRTDIYSLGHVLYQCIAGHHGFLKDATDVATLGEVTGWQLVRDVRPLTIVDPKLPGMLWLLVQKALRKDPNDRYQSGVEFAKAIRSAKLWLEENGYADPTDNEPAVIDRAIVAPNPKAVFQKKLPFAMTEEARPLPDHLRQTDVVGPPQFEPDVPSPHGTDVIPRALLPEPVDKAKGPKGTVKMQAVERLVAPAAAPPPAPPPPAPPPTAAPTSPAPPAPNAPIVETNPAHTAEPLRSAPRVTPPAVMIPVEPAQRGLASRQQPKAKGGPPSLRVGAMIGAALGIVSAIAFVATRPAKSLQSPPTSTNTTPAPEAAPPQLPVAPRAQLTSTAPASASSLATTSPAAASSIKPPQPQPPQPRPAQTPRAPVPSSSTFSPDNWVIEF